MPAKLKSQISLDDRIIKDDELEKLLEDRQTSKEAVGEYRKVDKKAKEKIASMSTPLLFRCGRFIISKQEFLPKSVAFETDGGSRISIKTAD